MIRATCALAAAVLLAVASAPDVAAWGQPDHAILGLHVVQRYADKLPSAITDAGTRSTFLYANYSPDYFVLQGPHYVHLDQNFTMFMMNHARDSRDLAYVYGWGAHQEEDRCGHGRYIVESGMTHLYKEIVMGTRLMYQGNDAERKLVRSCASVWNSRLINLATKDYRAKYGHRYREISENEANIVGYAFSAYLAGLKTVQWALWYGKLKRQPGKYPRAEWSGIQEEAIEQCRKWCLDPMSFSNVSDEPSRKQLFAKFGDGGGDALPRAEALVKIDSSGTKTRIRQSIQALSAPPANPGALRKKQAELGGHVLMNTPEFLDVCDKLIDSPAVQITESSAGDMRQIDVEVKEDEALLADFSKAVEAQPARRGGWPAFAAQQNDLRSMLKSIAKDASGGK